MPNLYHVLNDFMVTSFREFSILVAELADYTDFIPLVLLLFIKKRKPEYNYLLANFFIVTVIKIITNVLADKVANNMPLYHLISLVELVFLTLFYTQILKFKRQTTRVLLAAFLVLNVANSIFLQSIYEWNSYAISLNTLLYIYFGLYFFYRVYAKEETTNLFKYPLFYINVGFLVFFASTFFLFAMGAILLSSYGNSFYENTWIIQSISNILKNFVLAYGLVLVIRNYE
ncbi:hypothetical protein R9C00_04165 [Flammeovirgaceae bacterium SG7u.111]|nr:hypothetical protein [Flammeovirgaceae bacterium SG7u.132]WPO36642.1 hypothetical protein R9C00_04165 [Flammeovirgaceae bacterium SG7u.111]